MRGLCVCFSKLYYNLNLLARLPLHSWDMIRSCMGSSSVLVNGRSRYVQLGFICVFDILVLSLKGSRRCAERYLFCVSKESQKRASVVTEIHNTWCKISPKRHDVSTETLLVVIIVIHWNGGTVLSSPQKHLDEKVDGQSELLEGVPLGIWPVKRDRLTRPIRWAECAAFSC